MKIYSFQIDVNKITKEKLYKGKKGTYLQGIIRINDDKDNYGNDGFISENQTKEERLEKKKSNILGNIKLLELKHSEPSTGDDLPF